MIRRIVLQNFMSHEYSELVLAGAEDSSGAVSGGLTVLIGDNNSGKSAIVSALQVLSQNANGDYMVRHGQSESQVTVETKDPETGVAHEISWRRRKGKVSYVIDGREVDRLKGGIPDDLEQKLRLSLVQTAKGDEFDVHVGEQKRPIFLLSDRGSDRAAFFASSSDTSKLIEMQHRHRSRVKAAKAERKQHLNRSRELTAEIDRLSPLDRIQDQIRELEKQAEQISQQSTQIEQLRSLLTSLRQYKNTFAAIRRHAKVLSSLRPAPDFPDSTTLKKQIHQLRYLRGRRDSAEAQARVLGPLCNPPKIPDTTTLKQLLEQIPRIQATFKYWQEREQRLQKIHPPQVKHASELTTKLRELLTESQRRQGEYDRTKRILSRCTIDIEELTHQIEVHCAGLENCPTCGQDVDHQQLLDRGWLARFSNSPVRPDSPATVPGQEVNVPSPSTSAGKKMDPYAKRQKDRKPRTPGKNRKANPLPRPSQLDRQQLLFGVESVEEGSHE